MREIDEKLARDRCDGGESLRGQDESATTLVRQRADRFYGPATIVSHLQFHDSRCGAWRTEAR